MWIKEISEKFYLFLSGLERKNRNIRCPYYVKAEPSYATVYSCVLMPK